MNKDNCNKIEGCENITGPTFPEPSDKNLSPGCSTPLGSTTVHPTMPNNITCKPFQLTTTDDNFIIDQYVNESLNIGAAQLNVYKLLGVHEQCKLVDATGFGRPLSNGDVGIFVASNAFDTFISEWRSIQKGPAVLASAYLGYDFGDIKTQDQSRRMYGIDTSIRKHITAISIKQSKNKQNRITKVRVERSEDNIKWYGAGLVPLPDDDCLNTVLLRGSAPARYWRLRPIAFNGDNNDTWNVQALQLHHNYLATEQYNIQDPVFFENRDREYSTEPLVLKGFYDLFESSTELSRFGIELPTQVFNIQVNFSACVAILGRPIVIGDIIELPSEAQYSSEMRRILKWIEVTDVGWSSTGFTPGWQSTILKVTAQVAMASQETQNIFGDLAEQPVVDGLGLLDKGNGRNPNFQDFSDISSTIQSEAKDMVPQQGREGSSHIIEFTEKQIKNAIDQGLPNLTKIGLNPTGLFVEDAMPSNNAPFTEGTTFPNLPKDGDYHRLTYEGLSKDIPARLYRYSGVKSRWVFLESDKRAKYDPSKPTLQEFLKSPTKKPTNTITKQPIKQCDIEKP